MLIKRNEQAAGGDHEPVREPSAAVEEDRGPCAEVEGREGEVPTTGGETPVVDRMSAGDGSSHDATVHTGLSD